MGDIMIVLKFDTPVVTKAKDKGWVGQDGAQLVVSAFVAMDGHGRRW